MDLPYLSIDALHTATPTARFSEMHIYSRQMDPPPFSQNTFLLRKWLPIMPRAPEICTNKFSGVLNTMVQVSKL